MNSPNNEALVSSRSVVGVACIVTLVVAYRLFLTAQSTGNFEGMWFSLVHTVMVAVGVVCALCGSKKSEQS